MFGERQSRIIVSLENDKWSELAALATESEVPLLRLGVNGGTRFRLGGQLDLPLDEIAAAWSGGLDAALGGGLGD